MPLIEFGPTIVPSLTNYSLGSMGFTNLMSGVNSFRKGFMNQDTFDEPTYLTFYLDFDFSAQMTDSMTSLSASPLFDLGQTPGEVKTSAVSYLDQKYSGSIGDYLRSFNNTLRYITNSTPWYFQSISGLDKVWAQITGGLKTGVIGDIVVNVGCLEAIDMRIMQLAEFYQKAAYDNKWARTRLPDNLRHFNMRIYLGEIRDIFSNLNTGSTRVESPDMIVGAARNITNRPGGADSPNLEALNNSEIAMRMNSFYYVYFDCYQCEFDFSPILGGTGGTFNAFTAKDPYSSNFNIKIGRFEVAGSFGPNNYTSNLYRDQYLSSGQRAELGKNLSDSVISLNSAQLRNQNVTLDSLAQSLGPFSDVVQSTIYKAERGLNNLLTTPNRILNSAVAELQRAVEGKKFGNIYNNEGANISRGPTGNEPRGPFTGSRGPTDKEALGNIYD